MKRYITSNSAMTGIPSNMDIDSIREQSALFSIAGSKSSSICLKASSMAYHQHMILNNDLLNCKIQELINSFHLSYTNYIKKDESVSLATDSTSYKKD